jgi:hypothetical protein
LVSVTNQRTVGSFFGGVFGSDGYAVAGQATAQLYIPGGAAGLRPIAACESTVADSYQPNATPPIANPFIVVIQKSDAVCGTAGPGMWGYTNFLDQGEFGEYNDPDAPAYNGDEPCTSGDANAGGNANCQAIWTQDGYGGPVYFPNESTSRDTGLAGNTGVSGSSAWKAAFQALPDKVILLPVATAFDASRLDVAGVVTVRVCAVKWRGDVFTGLSDECAAERVPRSPSTDYDTWNTFGPNDGALWVIPTSYVTSGIVDPRADCDLGEEGCDFGTRAVRLYK